ncbi:hypothetical protein HYW75_00825 [Candidatus Pacearchaeota archaeon]|nr:hypothetical protein [Candidatus Pacearchaeota archaeon]
MKKRSDITGQFQLSFGMIFSIMIIIATLAIAGYVTIKFLNLENNISCKLFFDDLQKKIDKAWYEDFSSSTYSNKVPRGIDKICFGNSTQKAQNEGDQKILDEIEFYAKKDSNLLFYPLNGCKQDEFTFQIKHVKIDGFFCSESKSGNINIKLNKGISDALVKLSE